MNSAPLPDEAAILLDAEHAAELLQRWLDLREFGAAHGLIMVFRRAGALAQQHDRFRRKLSTRLLFFAACECDPDPLFEPEELAALSELRALALGRPEYRKVFSEYFRGPAKPNPGQPALTPNVERLLEAAMRHASAKFPRRSIAFNDLLLAYGTAEGKARRLLSELGISADDIRQLVPKKMAAPAESSHEDPAPAGLAESEENSSDAPGEPPNDSGKALPPGFNDSVATHADEPALVDLLERAPFATVLARNIVEARASGESEASAFIVHLHGPWGSGKSSVLNFLEAELETRQPPWLVVRFNAWRDQRRQPPWWSLITCIYAGAARKLDRSTARRLWWRWFKWRVRADFMPWAVSALLVAACVLLLVLGFTSSIGPTASAIGTVITLLGAGAVAVRSLALGSQRAAQTYAELKADPFQPMTALFDRLIGEIKRPVAVFIDDLDRCDSGYVVELLEGVQTLMRSAPVTYVVAADRKWICSSFEQRYAKFSPPIGEPGRPLGYLFLDKIFQVSAAVPQLAADIRASYWDSLINLSPAAGSNGADRVAEATATAREEAKRDATSELAGLRTHEELRGAVERAMATNDPIRLQATRAAAALRITSADASEAAEHRLKRYAHLLEPNPRAMKRLVNAYGMHQATLFLAGRSASSDALARWTILELRWPLLADFLAIRPARVDWLRKSLTAAQRAKVPEDLHDLFGDEQVAEVIGEAETSLNESSLRAILGSVQGDR